MTRIRVCLRRVVVASAAIYVKVFLTTWQSFSIYAPAGPGRFLGMTDFHVLIKGCTV